MDGSGLLARVKMGKARCSMEGKWVKKVVDWCILECCNHVEHSLALALVDESMSEHKWNWAPVGVSNNLLVWNLLGVFALIWSLYVVCASPPLKRLKSAWVWIVSLTTISWQIKVISLGEFDFNRYYVSQDVSDHLQIFSYFIATIFTSTDHLQTFYYFTKIIFTLTTNLSTRPFMEKRTFLVNRANLY